MPDPTNPPPLSAREEIAAILAADPVSPIVARCFDVLLARLERQADAIVRLDRRVRELDHRTVGSIRVGGR
jgi:hypothetical protein